MTNLTTDTAERTTVCPLVVVQDQDQPCPYLDDTTARMPLELPIGRVSHVETDALLASGYRRSGDFLYRTQCPHCSSCEPTRVPVEQFMLTNSMKRVLKRSDGQLRCEFSEPSADIVRCDLFNRHRNARKLNHDGHEVGLPEYRTFLVDSCCETVELSVWKEDALAAISIFDVGKDSTSAVYTHFDPELSSFSLGTYAILKQIEWAQANGRSYVYLGMFVDSNSHLNYKSRFVPQERLIDGIWTPFATDTTRNGP